MAVPTIQMPPTDAITAVGYKVADTRADLLIGQGSIIKAGADNTSAILRDANGNALLTNANIDRSVLASMSQTDKYGLAQLNAANGVNDNVTRTGFAGIQATHQDTGKLGDQANTIAWNTVGIQDAGFAASRAQTERINDAQSAFADRAAKYNAQMQSDSFARLSAQGENGFARELDATTQGTRQVVQSEIGVTRSVGDGFRDVMAGAASNYAHLSSAAAANYASLSAQNCQTKEVVAAYGNRSSDQTASVLATLSAQHAGITRDVMSVTRELSTQAALNAAAISLEAAKNAAAGQLEGAKNTAALQVQSALNAKDASDRASAFAREAALQAALNAKEGLLENSKWFALAEKTAMVNKCELEAKMAACCCEIKESVIGTANATQSLIQTNESSRVRDALSAAVAENSILRLRREEYRPAPYPVPYPYPHHHHHHRSRSPSPRRG